MDPTDLKIVRSIGIRPYASEPQDARTFKASFIAKNLGVEPATVKARLKRMETGGFIRFYQVYPNFSHLGVKGTAYLFNVNDEDRKGDAMKRSKNLEGINEMHDFIGRDLCVDLSYRSDYDLSKKLRLLTEFTGDSAPLCFYERLMPPVHRKLGYLDWRILKSLRYHARRPLKEVSDEVGVSLKTVKRRFERMLREGSIFIVPAIDPSKAPGVMLYELLVYLQPGTTSATIKKILGEVDDRYIHHYVPASKELGNFDVVLFCTSASEIEESRRRVAAISGVSKARALVFAAWNEYTDWIDAAIGQKMDEAAEEGGRRKSPKMKA